MLVGVVELVADHCRDAGLDAAGAEGDQKQPGEKAPLVPDTQGEAEVAQAIDQAQPQDGAVLAPEPIGQEPAQQGEQIDTGDKCVEMVLGQLLAQGVVRHLAAQQVIHQENREDIPHPVETEAFARFVSDDERDLTGQGGAGWRRWGAHGGGLLISYEDTLQGPLTPVPLPSDGRGCPQGG